MKQPECTNAKHSGSVVTSYSTAVQIYGKESQFDAARLIDLLGAYESFKVASTSARGAMDSVDMSSPTALLQSTAPGRYEPQGSAWPRVCTLTLA